jgi:signal transduction histidine kinase
MTGTKNLSEGNLQYRVDLPAGGEISALARAFNQMADELKKAQERLIREGEARLDLERSLRQSEKLATVGQLASGLAHEIGTPLNIIYGRTELIQRRLEDKEEISRNLAIILHQTERITRIVQQLLGIVRKKKAEHRMVHIHPILETTLDFLDHQIQKQQVRVVKDLQDDLLPVIGDPDQIQQVFLNLILNAIQAMPAGGNLHISAMVKMVSKKGLENRPRSYVEVTVEDSGTGMEKDVLENIFQPFFTGKESGTGLGLTVSQGIVQEHEGWIEVESKVEKGSVFRVYFPSCQELVNDGKDPA